MDSCVAFVRYFRVYLIPSPDRRSVPPQSVMGETERRIYANVKAISEGDPTEMFLCDGHVPMLKFHKKKCNQEMGNLYWNK